MRTLAALFLTAWVCAAQALVVGLTQNAHLITAEHVPGSERSGVKVLIIGGLDGQPNPDVSAEVTRFRRLPPRRRPFSLLAINAANPDRAKLQFPPEGPAYKSQFESHGLWRWMGLQA